MNWGIAVLLGLLAGMLARAFTPGPERPGLILTALLGIAGGLLATYLGQAIGFYQVGQKAGFLASVAGGMLILLVARFLRR